MEDVVEIERQDVVAVHQANPARQADRGAQLLYRAEAPRVVLRVERLQRVATDVPARQRQDHAPVRDAREKRRARERAPREAGDAVRVLRLQRAQKSIRAERGHWEVVRAREARQDLSPQPLRPQDHATPLD